MRRVVYFLITNIAILLVLSMAMRILGVEPYLTSYGLNYQSLLIFAAVFGMGGSLSALPYQNGQQRGSLALKL